jgi:ADP-heptose:LPS heptosyltransferase
MNPKRFVAQFRGQTDVAIALAPRSIDLAVAAGTRAPVRVGYTYVRRFVARLTARLYVNRVMISEADPDLSERNPHRHVRHEVNQLLDLVALAGANSRVDGLRLALTDEDRAASAYLPNAPIVLHLGLRWFREGSTLDSTLALMKQLHRFGVPLVVTYAPECEQYVKAIAESRLADVLLGGLPFYRWAAVLERARVVVTVDTGATHVASAVRRPTVVAFEHRYFRLNSQEWAPYGVPHKLVRKPGDESPESLARFRDDILGAVDQLIDHA